MNGHRPLRIVLIGDDAEVLQFIEECLRLHAIDYRLSWYGDGAEAFRDLGAKLLQHHHQPDVVMLDADMQGCEPGQVLHDLRTQSPFLGAPVALMSELEREYWDHEHLEGVRNFIHKSADLERYRRAVIWAVLDLGQLPPHKKDSSS